MLLRSTLLLGAIPQLTVAIVCLAAHSPAGLALLPLAWLLGGLEVKKLADYLEGRRLCHDSGHWYWQGPADASRRDAVAVDSHSGRFPGVWLLQLSSPVAQKAEDRILSRTVPLCPCLLPREARRQLALALRYSGARTVSSASGARPG